MSALRRLSNLSIMLLVVLAGSSSTLRAETEGERPDPEKIARMKGVFEKAEKERIAASTRALEQANAVGQGAEPGATEREPAPAKTEQQSELKSRPAKKTGKMALLSKKRHYRHHVHKKKKKGKKGGKIATRKEPVTSAPQTSQAPLPVPVMIKTERPIPVDNAGAEPVVPAQLARGTLADTAAGSPANLQPEDVARILATTRDLHGRDMSNLALQGFDFSGANLTDAVLQGAELYRADFSRANLTRANMQGASLERANFSEARMHGVQLSDTRLFSANMDGADLENARMRRCYAAGARLRKADLREADLRDSIFWGARFEGSNLAGALVEGTVLPDTAPGP